MIGHAVKLAEFRQAWGNELRRDIADYLGLARRWARGYEAYYNLAENGAASEAELSAKEDEVASILNDARVVHWRIQMRINPRENAFKQQDDTFLAALADVTDKAKVLPGEPDVHVRWNELAEKVVSEARQLLKREWEVTKQFGPRWLTKIGRDISAFVTSAYSRIRK